MSVFLLFLIVSYAVLLVWLLYGFYKCKEIPITTNPHLPTIKFTIIIPFRNEADNLSSLLLSLSKIHYPPGHFEILFVNDTSEDASEELIQTFFKIHPLIDFQILENKRTSVSPKKDAITTAISTAKHEWILTTDADCIMPSFWLQTLAIFIQKNNPKMVVGPVLLTSNKVHLLSAYQVLESISLAGVTIGSFGMNHPIMCNGANLAYQKDAFYQVKGFDGNNHIASGDDIFLMEKMKRKYPDAIGYIKSREAIVTTKTETTWAAAINQRVRWAAKSVGYKSGFSKFVGILILGINLALVIVFFSLFFIENWGLIICLMLLKFLMDKLFIFEINKFFLREIPWTYFWIMAFLYPFLTLFISWKALFGTYIWKGRTFKK